MDTYIHTRFQEPRNMQPVRDPQPGKCCNESKAALSTPNKIGPSYTGRCLKATKFKIKSAQAQD